MSHLLVLGDQGNRYGDGCIVERVGAQDGDHKHQMVRLDAGHGVVGTRGGFAFGDLGDRAGCILVLGDHDYVLGGDVLDLLVLHGCTEQG